ncbi:MAG: hypothetical protein EBQ92_09280 [Proteobacteria bacterium]|nr:hypothetical protein [Pseudomonadota bacterium]
MNRIHFLISFFALSVFSFSLEATKNPSTFPVASERMLCTTITQAQQVRFNRCRNGEVMTGIQSLEPLTVYCTTLMANCRNQKNASTKLKTKKKLADPIQLPWQEEISNTSSGYSEQEAAGKVHYYLKKEIKTWEGFCEIAEGKFRAEYSKIKCEEYYSELWDCTGSVTAYCD